ncbi:flavin reductase family protein [Pelomonas sp. KK5]|uniref:flavin reductase family protein n=1 Tax=Pelomonas sp. KK5 TaxID=1855730 RepID=UPI00097BC05F|nr:flavin reductase family protein [Pelomonas sp. KK5]
MKQVVELKHASRLVNHGPTVLVSARHEGRRTVMAAAWSMPVEFTPPRIAIVLDKSTFTRELALASGQLAISIPCKAVADLAYTVGSVSGAESDKFERYGIAHFDGPALGLPLIEGCIAWLECRVISEPHSQDAYDTVFVEVVGAQSDPRVFANGRWSFREDNTELHTLHHLGAGLFAVPSLTVQAKTLDPTPR